MHMNILQQVTKEISCMFLPNCVFLQLLNQNGGMFHLTLFRGSNFEMDTNPKIFHCLNPGICAWTSCSLHGSLGQNLLAQAHQKPANRDRS